MYVPSGTAAADSPLVEPPLKIGIGLSVETTGGTKIV